MKDKKPQDTKQVEEEIERLKAKPFNEKIQAEIRKKEAYINKPINK